MRLSIKVITIYLFSVLSALAALSVLGINLSIHQATESFKEASSIALTSLAITLEEDLESAYAQVDEIAAHPSVKALLSAHKGSLKRRHLEKEVIDILREHTHFNDHFLYAYIGMEDDSILADHPLKLPKNYTPLKRPWYIEAMEQPDRTIVSSIYVSQPDEIQMASISKTIRNQSNCIAGVIGIDFLFSRYQTMMQDLAFQSGFIIITHNNASLIAHSRNPERGFTDLNCPFNTDLRHANQLTNEEVATIDGKAYTTYVQDIHRYHLKILTFISQDVLQKVRRNYILLYGLTAGVLLCIVGITGARLARNALKVEQDSIRAKHDFFKNMNHEIRTPLNAVIGFVDLLEATPLEPKQRRWLDHTRTAATHLAGIVNDVLDLSSMRAGKYRIINKEYSFHDLIDHVIALVEQAIGAKKVQFRVSVSPKIPGALCGDSLRLKQILLNILYNAVKFTQEGLIAMKVAVHSEEERLCLEFIITDTGCGIASHHLPHIFEEFTQFASSDSQGTGLGLALTRQLIERMGGTITCTSTPGKGTHFQFTLIQKTTTPGHYRPTEAAEEPPSIAFTAPLASVLVVEDDPLSQIMICEILDQHLIQTQTAETGEEFLAAMESTKRFHLVLTDIKLPDTTGLEVAKTLRKRFPQGLPPLVALSAGDTPHPLSNTPFDAAIQKPIDTKSFKKELLFWLPSKLIEKKPPHSDANSMALRRKTLGEQLYTQLLRVFADDHTESSNILVKMVSEKRWNGLLVRIHRIKGALLNIGASKTAAHAQAIETKLEENKKISPAEIHELNRALYALLAEIKFLLRESKV